MKNRARVVVAVIASLLLIAQACQKMTCKRPAVATPDPVVAPTIGVESPSINSGIPSNIRSYNIDHPQVRFHEKMD